MASTFRTQRTNSTNQQAFTLRIQQAVQGVPRPIVYGQARMAGNMIDYGGFVAEPVSSPGGGKGGIGAQGGGKGQSGTWNYFAGGCISLGEPIGGSGVLTIYNGSAVNFLFVPPTEILEQIILLGITPTFGDVTYFAAVHDGQPGQQPDGGWLAQFGSGRALAYRGEAYVCFESLALGSAPTFPNFNFEVMGAYNSDLPALGPDANPADVIQDLLTNQSYGVPGFPSSAIGDFNTARNYWRVTGLMVSDVVASGVSAQNYLTDLMRALNCDFAWSSGKLNIVPYAVNSTTGNGFSFTPNLTPIYDLTTDDFLPNKGSMNPADSKGNTFVAVSRKSLNDVANKVQVEYLSRGRLYDPVTVYATDDASIVATGRLKISDLRQNHFFALDAAAQLSAGLQLQRETMEIVTYQFTLGRMFILLDVMDIVSITEPALQLEEQLVRILEIQENDDYTLTFTVMEVPGVASQPLFGAQPSLGEAGNLNFPGPNINPPIFYEPPDQIGGGLEIWIGLSGQIPEDFGGCDVYVSSDGETYTNVGAFNGQSRMGVTTSAITAVTPAANGDTIDNVNSPGVDLTESGGQLASGSQADLKAFNTAFVVDREIMAYQTATMTGTDQYTLSPIARGGYGTTIAAHAVGANFLRLDGNFFKFPFDASRIGQTLYFKFPSFNPFGGGGQQLSAVGAYPYAPTGAALASPLPNVTNLYTNFASGFQQIFWDEIQDFRAPISYEIRQGSSWAAAVPIRTQLHPPFIAQGNGTFWVAGKYIIPGMTIYSATPASIVISGNQLSSNLIFSYDEEANTWPGTKAFGLTVQGAGTSSSLVLTPTVGGSDSSSDFNADFGGPSSNIGQVVYYTSADIIDIGYVAQASVNASTTIVGVSTTQNILSETNVLVDPDILGSTSTQFVDGWIEINVGVAATSDAFVPADIFAPSDVFAGVDIQWSGWQKFVPGVQLGQFFQFRLAMVTYDMSTQAVALAFNEQVQVPARIDHYQNLSVPSSGLAIVFQPDGATTPAAYNGGPNGSTVPYVNVSYPGGAGVGYYTVSALTLSGLTITFFNSSGVAISVSGVNVDTEGY